MVGKSECLICQKEGSLDCQGFQHNTKSIDQQYKYSTVCEGLPIISRWICTDCRLRDISVSEMNLVGGCNMGANIMTQGVLSAFESYAAPVRILLGGCSLLFGLANELWTT
ncbi:uncharacterized protein LOC144425187 [Styela clava]